ncbi:patatin-like phospholipase family protein [Sphingomonas sp. 1185]|uniref:patatin-like phospholipase family protein n=1 Tax=Sphingomonas sp. 1185 TaxID=3156411 RepID=UPI0033924107
MPPDLRIALVLAGGNALGAYQAGVYEALHDAGIAPDWIVGTSVGAINGAIIAGNAPEDRLPRLSDLWRPEATDPVGVLGWDAMIDSWRRSGEVIATLLGGRRGLFAPLGIALAARDTPALYDTTALACTLARLVDFDRLNDGAVRYMAQAVTLDTGEEVVFDSGRGRIAPDHIRASCAMPPAFPPVAVEGTLYVDGGLSANLPLDPVLARPGDAPLLCIAVDLLPLAGPRPPSIGGMISRTQDLAFAAQSRRTGTRSRPIRKTRHESRPEDRQWPFRDRRSPGAAPARRRSGQGAGADGGHMRNRPAPLGKGGGGASLLYHEP